MVVAKKPTNKKTIPDLEQSVAHDLIPEGFSLKQLVSDLCDADGLSQKQRAILIDTFQKLLSELPDPVQALNLLNLFLSFHTDETYRNHLFSSHVLHQILSLFSYSFSLGKSLLKHPTFISEIFPVVHETKEQLNTRLETSSRDKSDGEEFSRLRKLKTKEFIRIMICDGLKLDTFEETTAKIALVANQCVQRALASTGLDKWPVTVIAMGKWGGMELNYSSDIDLLFVASDAVTLDDLPKIHHLATKTVNLLEGVTEDGFVFRIDNRLRPEGATGPLVRTINQYIGHYKKYALGWELQALVKARPGAGNSEVAAEFIERTKPLVYNSTIPPEILLQKVREMKGKIENALLARDQHNANVKLGVGGIRDIEFIIQFLQLHHGRVNSNLRHFNTLTTIQRLFAHRIITKTEHRILTREYVFLRELEHFLQIGNELPIRQLPKELISLNILGRKMGFSSSATQSAGEKLVARYKDSIKKTRRIFQYFFDMTINFLNKKKNVRELCPTISPAIIDGHFIRLESDYFLQFQAAEIAEHIRMVSRLSNSHTCDLKISERSVDEWQITIVANDYLGEFAVICGLLSAFSLNILSGESFTYADPSLTKALTDTDTFYRRREKRYYSHRHPSTNGNSNRKIVCVANVKLALENTEVNVDWAAFRNDLYELIGLLRDQEYDQASERSTLKVIKSLKKRAGAKQEMRVLPPLEFTINNDSDDRYTILEISSEDQFMFLFEFANALATRNYYIGKVEISTKKGKAQDRLFITTREGRKITSEKRLHDLTVTITLIKQFSTFLHFAPNPHLALKQFSNFTDCVLDAKQQGAIPIIEQRDTMKDLARILGTSSFLWEDFLRMQSQNLLPLLMDAKKLNRRPSVADLRRRLRGHLKKYPDHGSKIASLNRFKDREMFRIDLRHLTRRVPHFTDFCKELTDLTDVIMSETLRMAIRHTEDKLNRQEPGVSVLCALGKWGSMEVGYASDIELLFIWDSDKYEHYEVVEYYEHVVRTIATSIKSKLDGIFELDFRLRPGGKHAPLAIPFKRFKDYYSENGGADAYERQSLVRLRTISGDRELRKRVEARRLQDVFGQPCFDVGRICDLRRRQEQKMVKPGEINAKFSPGGLVEAEYFIQILQIQHGYDYPDIQCTNTLHAAEALKAHHFLDGKQFQKFNDGYRFLRALINGLRIVRGNAKDLVIPERGSQEFHYLVRRLESFEHAPGIGDAWEYVNQQMGNIHELFLSLST